MLIIKYAKLAEKGYLTIKIMFVVFSIILTVLISMSVYNNTKQKKYLKQLDSTAINFIENVETHILESTKHSDSCDIHEVGKILEEVNGIDLVVNKKDNIVFIKSENKNDENWDMEVNWQYGTNNLSVVVYDPTGTYMWSNHFPKERFEVY